MAFDVPAQSRARRDVFLRPITATKAQGQELAAILLRVMGVWESNTTAIVESYTPRPFTGDAPADSENVLRRVEEEIDVLLLSVGAGIRQWALRVERWHRQRWAESVFSATNVDLRQIMTGQVVEETLEAFIARNVSLSKDLSAEARRRIADAIYRGYQQRLSAADVAKEIRGAVKMGKDRAIRIAGDQLSKVSAALDKERQLEAGFTLGKYRHSGKRHPREWHKARDGKVYDLKTRREVGRDGKAKVAGDRILPEDWPGFPPFCGCRMGAFLPFELEREKARP